MRGTEAARIRDVHRRYLSPAREGNGEIGRDESRPYRFRLVREGAMQRPPPDG